MTDIEKFVNQFQQQYIDADDFKMDDSTEFRKIGSWDSLTGMAILIMIQDNYQVTIPDGVFRSFKLVREVFDYVMINKPKS